MWTRRRSSAAALLALALAAPAARADGPPAAEDPALAHDREQFKQGMALYESGQIRAAIDTWLPIYAELGPERGYRLSYNLGVAYEQLGDATNAADRYESFLHEVDARRGRGDTIESLVAADETDARQRLAGLQASKGRLRIVRGGALEVSIDGSEPRVPGYTAYVAPGQHRVRFVDAKGAADVHVVDVPAGQLVEVAPTPPPVPPPVPSPTPSAPPTPPRHVEPPPMVFHTTEHPFSPVVLYALAGLTAASVVAPILTYQHAFNLKDTYDASTSTSEKQNILRDYDGARAVAYLTLAVPITLAAATLAMTGWYFLGARDREVPTTIPAFAPVQGGGVAGVSGRF